MSQEKTSPSRLCRRIGLVLSALASLFLLFDAAIKLVPIEVVQTTMQSLGYPGTAEFARFLGVLTLVCTALYVYPRTALLGAVLLTGLFGGAIATHVRVGSPLFSHILFGGYLGAMVWGGLLLRRPHLLGALVNAAAPAGCAGAAPVG